MALTGAAATCGYLFNQINPVAGYIFVPYLGWLSFATFLNYTLYRINDDGVEKKAISPAADKASTSDKNE